MRSQWRALCALLALALVALAAGCGGSSGSSSSGGGGSAAPSEDKTPVTLTLWHPWTGDEKKIFEAQLQKFEAQYPWITVKAVGYPGLRHVRRPGDQGDQGRQRPRRRALVRPRLRRPVLLERPDAGSLELHGSGRRHARPVRAGRDHLHAVRRQAVHAAVADRLVRPLLQQGHVREGGDHVAAQDHDRADGRRQEADGQELRRLDQGRRASCRCRTSSSSASTTWPACGAPSSSTTTAIRCSRPIRRGRPRCEWQKQLIDYYGYDNIIKFNAAYGGDNEFSASQRVRDR